MRGARSLQTLSLIHILGEDLKLNRIKLKDVVKTIEEDDPTEDEMNQRTRVILLLEEIRQTFKKKRKIYAKLDECCTLERRVTAIQKEIMAFKEEIVTRLRDIKLEKTLIDRKMCIRDRSKALDIVLSCFCGCYQFLPGHPGGSAVMFPAQRGTGKRISVRPRARRARFRSVLTVCHRE